LRYLRGTGQAAAVPLLSRISMAAIGVGAGALIVLFSVFNGFEQLIQSLYAVFYPDVRITAVQGKTFTPDAEMIHRIEATPFVARIAPLVEDKVLAGGATDDVVVVTMKGVDSNWSGLRALPAYMRQGSATVGGGEYPSAVVGAGIGVRLGLNAEDAFSQLALHYPNADASALDPSSAARSLVLRPEGIFTVDAESDEKYVVIDIAGARELLGLAESDVSALEVAVTPGEEARVGEALKTALGAGFKVETRAEQNRALNLIMQAEKWTVYAILVMVLLIASVNLVGALSMLVLQKSKDIAILRAMGATPATVRNAVLLEGALWALVGGGMGTLLGALLCLGQQKFGWMAMQGQFIIEAYPVALVWTDFVVVMATVALLGMLAAVYPAWRAGRVQGRGLRSA